MSRDTDRRARNYLVFRLLIILVGFGLITFYQVWLEPAFREHSFHYLYGVLGGYLAFGVILLATHSRWRSRHAVLRWQVVGDFLIQSLLVWGTGGVFSIFSPVLFVTLAAATTVISARGAFLLATLVTLFLSATTIAYGLGVTPAGLTPAEWHYAGGGSAFVVSYLLASVLALYAVSLLGSRFSHGLRTMAGIHSEILENMAEGLIAVDVEGRVLELNKEARTLLGLMDRAAVSRKQSLELLLPSPKHASLRDAFRQRKRRRIETEITLRDGHERPVEVKISSVCDDAGKTRWRIGLVSDLSLQRDMEAAALRIQKLEDLHVMALGIAHEIRNPLASICGCVQEIARCLPENPSARRYMEIVQRESARLDGILEDFLVFARPGPLDLVPIDLARVIEESAELIKSRPQFGSRSIALNLPRERPRIFGDHNRLIQVFLNLGLNAIDATNRDGGMLVISLRARQFATMQEKAGGRDLVPGVEVEFRDDGKGISEADLGKIFTPFFTTKETGNGLGLCIVNRVVREHMGVVDVKSVEGRGTEFRLWFPVLRSDAPQERGGMEDDGEEITADELLECCSHA